MGCAGSNRFSETLPAALPQKLNILDISNNSLTGAHARSQQAGYERAACQSTCNVNGALAWSASLERQCIKVLAKQGRSTANVLRLGQLQACNMPFALAPGSLPAAWAAHTNLTAIFLFRNKLAGMHAVTGPLHHPLLQGASVLQWQCTLFVLAACLSNP